MKLPLGADGRDARSLPATPSTNLQIRFVTLRDDLLCGAAIPFARHDFKYSRQRFHQLGSVRGNISFPP